jgi:hypothetical protein
LAAELAGGRPEDEPAAIIFALSRARGALGEAWEVYPLICVRNLAAAHGFQLDARPGEPELENLRLRVAWNLATFDDVRAWADRHRRPLWLEQGPSSKGCAPA